ncbi:MAG: TetR/AcrR family transcriptional regulator [Gulosibacter sp.]|uniref:TetR/AcrR family transcriptional regulator n=1 Tax=Gulosibacter sp. TaxID=2817531 RepID=UPI003F937F74
MAVRSEESRKAILESTMKLLDVQSPDHVSVQRLSIERIAREAGVSKTTIYRWWPNKAAVIIESFLDNHIARTPVRKDIPAIDALREHLISLTEIYATHEGSLVAQLIGECQYDAQVMTEFKERFWYPRVEATRTLIERAISEGGIRKDASPEVIAEMLYGPVYFRLLLESGPLSPKWAKEHFENALLGLEP